MAGCAVVQGGLEFRSQAAMMEGQPFIYGGRIMQKPLLDQCRYFLKDSIRQEIDFSQTDQYRGVEPPPLEKPYPAEAKLIGLPPVGQWEESRRWPW